MRLADGTVGARGTRAAANAPLQQLGLPIEVRPRHVYVADDIAVLIVDWTITGTGRHGQHVDITGTATGIAWRGQDGATRYLIGNPLGTASGNVHEPRPRRPNVLQAISQGHGRVVEDVPEDPVRIPA